MLALEFIAIACLLFAGLSIILTSMKTGISPVPSTGEARKAILSAVENSGAGPVMDLGSGWGTLVVALARQYPNRQIIGYELSWVPWAFSSIRKYIFQLHNLTLSRQDFRYADLSRTSVIVCYLFTGGMMSLQEKLAQETHGEIRIVSSTFALPSGNPTNITRLNDMYRTRIYVYQYAAVTTPEQHS